MSKPTCLNHQWQWHLGAALLHSLSFHFLPMTTSDWTRFHKLDQLGLRYGQQEFIRTQVTADFWILSHCALPLISVSVAALAPSLIDLACLLSCWATRAFSYVHKLIYPADSRLSLERFRRNTLRVTLLTAGIGILFSEALGILLLAAQILYKVYLLLSVDGISTGHVRAECLQQSVERSTPVRCQSFRFHRLVALTFVLLSLLLTENWVSLHSRARRYVNTGFVAVHILFRSLPDSMDASLLIMYSLLTVVTLYIGPWPSKSLTHEHGSRTQLRHKLLISGSVFVVISCVFLLMHTAVQCFSMFTLSVIGLCFFTFGLSPYQRSMLGISMHLINHKQN
ncbi:unnamed protein product [Dicrocoelium dendriticum]|nr:unnamed protein product [Dicrocoelium dendriticum]